MPRASARTCPARPERRCWPALSWCDHQLDLRGPSARRGGDRGWRRSRLAPFSAAAISASVTLSAVTLSRSAVGSSARMTSDAGIDRPGDRQPPRFAAGNAGAVFAEAGFDAARQAGKDVVGRRGLQRLIQLMRIGVGVVERDVDAQAGIQHVRMLADIADALPPAIGRGIVERHAGNLDRAGARAAITRRSGQAALSCRHRFRR